MANMLNIVLKNFLKKPKTRLYPLKERDSFERTRHKIHFETADCIHCGICQRKCPADAIKVNRAEKIWELNAYRCIICGECVNVCPKKCITMLNKRRDVAENKKYISIKKVD
ncbi:formate hydrogenlyase [Fervidicella metallireducens AeB]|uniref:Formate hydrogenlyase n=1 Tax=Fervidicella metallireducens AeB TaxID=1403537 RepID=A0A017RX43_9CLOT|nr:4Fe-4S dicluster domain-containing protein [Fervidicella metallireducens]EYE89141.1 formate hydrogenlyase [Fervidicella metallireducens AeB]